MNIVFQFEDRSSEGSILDDYLFIVYSRDKIYVHNNDTSHAMTHRSFVDESERIVVNFYRFSSISSFFPSFSAAAATDSAIISRDEAIIFPIVILRNYSSLRSRPVRCRRVSRRFHCDFRKVHRKKREELFIMSIGKTPNHFCFYVDVR